MLEGFSGIDKRFVINYLYRWRLQGEDTLQHKNIEDVRIARILTYAKETTGQAT